MAQNAPFSSDTLMDLLRTVQDPQTGLSLASAGRLESCTVDDGGRLTLTLGVAREQAPALSALCDAAAQKLQTLPNITKATIILTAHRPRRCA
uniref:iron-sulfur cluster assembly protein n=1 Tax=Acetobacter okinawensis TaxID=1076594 RepID=UPI000470D0D2